MEEQAATRSKKRSILALSLVFGPALILIFMATRGCDHRFKKLADYGLVKTPTFSVYNHKGKQELSLQDYQDQVVLVTTLQTTCPYQCGLAFFPLTQNLYKDLRTNKRKKLKQVRLLSIVVDSLGNPVSEKELLDIQDMLKSKVEGFVQTMPFGRFKVVLMDEADYLSHNAQAIMRGLLETYASQARFIFTCNKPHKIMDALHSRCQGFHIDKTDETEFTARVATILVTEGVEFDLDTLDSYCKATYPDLRKCLNLLQANSTEGTLDKPGENDRGVRDWKLDAVELMKSGRIREARQAIINNGDNHEEIFRWMYDNLNIWSKTESGQDEAIIVIRKGLVNHSMVADPEINLSATLVELTQITS